MENEKGNREKAIKLLRTSVIYHPNYREGWIALKKLEDSGLESIGDWYRWWFSNGKKSNNWPLEYCGLKELLDFIYYYY